MRHRHRLISDLGSTVIEFDDDQPIAITDIAVGDYWPNPVGLQRRAGGVRYAGYAITDRAGCPACLDQ